MSTARFAFELAYGQLRGQKEDLKSFRGQASFCAAISGIIATAFSSLAPPSFLSSMSNEGMQFLQITFFEWFVIITLTLSVLFAILAIIHWQTCTFELNPAVPIHHAEENQERADAMYLKLAKDADQYFDQNEAVITEVRVMLLRSLVFAFLQIPAWIILILLQR